jgi:hypothetical protein
MPWETPVFRARAGGAEGTERPDGTAIRATKGRSVGQHRILRAAACALLSAGAMLAAAPAARAAEEAPDTRTQLDMLTHEVEGLRQQLWAGPRVNGYYAFEYTADSRAQSPATFNQQAFSLFIGRNWDRWRVLTEIEYEDGPDIEVARDAMGNPAATAASRWNTGGSSTGPPTPWWCGAASSCCPSTGT